MKYLARLLLTAIVVAVSPGAVAQGVTIGGTPAEGESATGFTSMFSGDLYDNFRNMQRFVPTSVMTPGEQAWDLGANADTLEFTGDFLGEPTSLENYLALSNTSALLVIKDGGVIFEHYAHGDSVDSLHTSFSVAKSFVATLVGIAVEEGLIKSIDEPIRKYLPQLTSKTWDDVTIRHVLQMSSGVRFNETYTDPESDINKMGVMTQEMSYLEYINTLERDHAPGTFNHYASINTQLLGILLVEVSGKTLTEYMQEKLWQPIGMEQEGRWTLDEQGYELAMGGMSASARDYAKLALVYLHGGKRGEQQIVPAEWVKAAVTPDAPHLQPGDNPASSNPSGYAYQWWTPRDPDGDFLARGIWGQTVYVHPGNNVVIVKLAADAKNFEKDYKLAYIDYLQDLAQSLK
ncbi:MAG: serine hydrolase [Halioglobus sp.]|nr:serine hydrolase [Halioglobus sp.]